MDEIVEAFAGLRAMFTRLRLQRLRIPLGGALQGLRLSQGFRAVCKDFISADTARSANGQLTTFLLTSLRGTKLLRTKPGLFHRKAQKFSAS